MLDLPPDAIYLPDFIDEGLQFLVINWIDKQPWMNTSLARRVQHYGYRYDYRKRTVDVTMYLGEIPPELMSIAKLLKKGGHIQTLPDQCIINEYKPGQGIMKHVDCQPCFKDTIVTISLGWAYEMNFLKLGTNAMPLTKLLEVGSALILRGESRNKWMHEIPARYSDLGKSRGRRISVTFRNVKLEK